MAEYRVMLYEPMHELGTGMLEAECAVVYPQSLDEDSLTAMVGEIDAIVVRANGRVSDKIMAAAPRLRVVGRHGVGVENIDVEAAGRRGIWVVNTPEANKEPVAEHFLMLALTLSKKFLPSLNSFRKGDWDVRYRNIGREMAGKMVGVVGFGRIGRQIAAVTHSAFGCPILYYDSIYFPEQERILGARKVTLEELLRESDYVSLNVPLTPETKGLIGREAIALMKKSAILINTARGGVWDEEAVREALSEKRIAGAGTDVFASEPAPGDHPLLALDNFAATPHMAAHTEESLARMSLVAEDILRVLHGEKPLYPLNEV